MTAISELML